MPDVLAAGPAEWLSPSGITSTLQMMLAMAVISMAPAALLMTTCFVRVVVVLGLLRQALGTQQLPPNQVLTSLAMFITLFVMLPVWTQVYDRSVKPYANHEIDLETAWQAGSAPMHRFMSQQIERTGNSEDVWLFLKHLPKTAASKTSTSQTTVPQTYDDVPLAAIAPAFMLSELKTSFLIGFQIYLPFLVLDVVVSAVLGAMGLMMLPPALVSLPLKLLLFVMVDGWRLIVGMLLDSFETFA